MIKFHFKPGWANDLVHACTDGATPSPSQNELESNDFRVERNTLLSWLDSLELRYDANNIQLITAILIRRCLNTFANDGSLYGLFSLISSTNQLVSPFTATHDYHIRILHCNLQGSITLNISPIYRLGPEYPDHYRRQHGKDLDQDAILGLLTNPDDVMAKQYDQQPFTLGIDAGVAFKDSHIAHNKTLLMQFEFSPNKIGVSLQSDGQAMAKTFSQVELALQALSEIDVDTLSVNDDGEGQQLDVTRPL